MFLLGLFVGAVLTAVVGGGVLWYVAYQTIEDAIPKWPNLLGASKGGTVIEVDELGRVFEIADDGQRTALSLDVVVEDAPAPPLTVKVTPMPPQPGLRTNVSWTPNGLQRIQQLQAAAVVPEFPIVVRPAGTGFAAFYGLPGQQDAVYYAGTAMTAAGADAAARLKAMGAWARARESE